MKKGYLEDYEYLEGMFVKKQKNTFHMAENFEQFGAGEELCSVLDAEAYKTIK